MSYTEQELENKIRNIILEKIISVNPKIQLLQSKDVTDIICCRNDDNPCLFFIEIKHFSISNNRIGFGSKGKITFQPEILKTRPAYFEKYTRWIFFDSNFKDYYILSNSDCRKYIMGNEISYDKQNNFKLNLFTDEKKYSEEELCQYLSDWFSSN